MHVVSAISLLIIFLLPVSEYSWMQEMDPSVTVESTDGNAMIFSLILLTLIILLQLIVSIKSEKSIEKNISISIVFLSITVWIVRFLVV